MGRHEWTYPHTGDTTPRVFFADGQWIRMFWERSEPPMRPGWIVGQEVICART
jgi:hypothetical protein